MKHKLLALGFAGLCMVSCSDDDNNAQSSSVDMSKLTKKWYEVSDEVNGEVFPAENEACGKDYIEFLTNGTAISGDVYDCAEGQPVVDELQAPYTVSGTKVTITIAGIALEGTVKELTNNKLVVETHDDYDGDETVDTIFTTYTSQP